MIMTKEYLFIDVTVIDFGDETDLGWLEWIFGREINLE